MKVVLTDYAYDTLQPFSDVYQAAGVEFIPLQCKSKQEVLQATEYADGVMTHYAHIDREVIDNLKNCKIIIRSAVGVENIDVEAANQRGISVANVPDYCIEEVSDYVILLLLASAKKFCVLERMVQRGEWDYAITKPSDTIHGKTLGLVGCGNIARAVARKAKVFDMDIIGCDPGVTEQEVAKYGIHLLPQEKVLQDSDFLSLHAPLNRYTKHMINRETLSQMKPGAILINTAGGPLVDEQALREAVLSGHLAGAALDVLNEEPVRPDAPLLGQEQIILTPHCAWYSETAMHTLLKSAAEEVVRALRGEPLFHPVSHN